VRTKDGFSVASSVLFATGISALLASSAILAGSAIALQRINRAPAITLSTEPFEWLGKMSIATAELPVTTDDGTSLAYPNKLTWDHFDLPGSAGKSSRALFAKYHAPKPAREPKIQNVESPLILIAGSQGPAVADQVTWASAAPVANAQSVADADTATDLDRLKMQELYSMLRRTFYAELDIQGPARAAIPTSLSIQYLGLDSIPEADLNQAVGAEAAVAWVADHLPRRHVQMVAMAKKARQIPQKKTPPVVADVQVASAISNIANTQVQPAPTFSPQAGSVVALNSHFEEAVRDAGMQTDRLVAAAAWLRAEAQSTPTIINDGDSFRVTANAMNNQAAQSDQVVSTQGHPVIAAEGEYSNGSVKSVQLALSSQTPAASKSAMNATVGSQTDSHAGRGQGSTQRNVQTGNDREQSNPGERGVSQGGYGVASASDQELAATFVEAFGSGYPIEGVATEALTRQSGSRWELNRAFEHVATLARVGGELPQQTIPLISLNTARLLAMNAGVRLQSEAGIVFGRIPAGWTVEFSGRSERPIFFDMSLRQIAGNSIDQARHFLFLNAAPGAQLIKVAHEKLGSGSIAIPVVGATATYIDLSDLHAVQARGAVYNGGSSGAEGLEKIRVRIGGHPETERMTDARGRFVLESVVTAGAYPVVVETESATGFTHRYQVSPRRLRGLALFRMSDEQVQGWISQLEGGVSPESGMIVAAVSEDAMERMEKKPLYPTARTLSESATLKPEAYSVSSEGYLQHKEPVNSERPRVVSVQVPEGPALIEARSSANSVEWSELVFAQPGIINVVGP